MAQTRTKKQARSGKKYGAVRKGEEVQQKKKTCRKSSSNRLPCTIHRTREDRKKTVNERNEHIDNNLGVKKPATEEKKKRTGTETKNNGF